MDRLKLVIWKNLSDPPQSLRIIGKGGSTIESCKNSLKRVKKHTFSHVCSSWKDKTHFLKIYKNSKFYCRPPPFSKGFVNIIEISKCVKNMKISLLWLIFLCFSKEFSCFYFLKLLAPCLCSSVEHVFKKVFR